MGSKINLLILWVACFLSLVIHCDNSFAQQGSVYISAGYNMAWFGTSTIHIEQSDLGNSYNMVRVKGDNKTHTPISPTTLNYRIGYFYNEEQTHGIELSFDPVNYQITPNRNITIKGIVNNTFNVDKTVSFPGANGAYYQMTGANLITLNMVKRVRIYMANTKLIAVDAIGKIGAGPALPHFGASLPINPVDDPGLNFAGWNAGGELGVRVRGYRYIYLDVAGRYNYASFNSLKVYDGTARQNLNVYEVVASIGFTFPTHRLNPLFFREHNIITIKPMFLFQDEWSKTTPKRKVKYDVEGNEDTTTEKPLDSIPEFDEIVERKYRKEHPIDTVKATWYVDSLGRPIGNDSISAGLDLGHSAQDTSEKHLTKRQLRKKKKAEARARKAHKQQEPTLPDQNGQGQDSTKAATLPTPGQEPAPPSNPDAKTPEPAAPPSEPKAPEQAAPKTDQTTPDVKEPEKKEPEVKPAEEQKEPELSKKERKRRAKEERRAQKEKAKEEKAKASEAGDNATPPAPPATTDKTDTTGKGQ